MKTAVDLTINASRPDHGEAVRLVNHFVEQMNLNGLRIKDETIDQLGSLVTKYNSNSITIGGMRTTIKSMLSTNLQTNAVPA